MTVALYTAFAHSSISAPHLSPKLCSPIKAHFQTTLGLRCSPQVHALKLRGCGNARFGTIRCFKNNKPEESDKKDRMLDYKSNHVHMMNSVEMNNLLWLCGNTQRDNDYLIDFETTTNNVLVRDEALPGLKEGKELNLRILKRWDVPWNWQTISLTSLACGLSFILTGLIEAATIPYSGIVIEELSLDEKAEILFVDQAIATTVVLAVLLSLTKSFSPLPDDIYRYDWREPFNLKKGWLLWAGIGLGGALAAIAVTGAAMSFFSGDTPERETDALVRLLPLIGSSNISTACLIGITGVLAPILEETVFRGFLMVSLTKWLPTPISVLISAAVFAGAHVTPGEFPQLFVLGSALGFSYAQTRNLLTPITIHALWNSGVILLLTFLQLQGYDIKELLQAS